VLDSQASYNPTFDFGISLASNSLYGMNTSQDDAEAQTDGEFSAIVACWVRYQISHAVALSALSRGNQRAHKWNRRGISVGSYDDQSHNLNRHTARPAEPLLFCT
jgi:hypothetical protein